VGGAVACDSLLEVDLPGNVPAESLDNPAMATTLVNSALGQFECAYTSYVVSTGILAQAYINASSWLNINTRGWRGLDLQSVTGNCTADRSVTGMGAYTAVQQARCVAEEASRLISGFEDSAVEGKSEKLARLGAYA